MESLTAADFVEKTAGLKALLCEDLRGCDAKWTLFVAAALSYRYESLLKPFPRQSNGDKLNLARLIEIIINTPALDSVLEYIQQEKYDELNTDSIDLLHLVLVTENDPTFRLVPKEKVKSLMAEVAPNYKGVVPNDVFELCPSRDSKSEKLFQEHKNNYETSLAFHGSKLDTFYSIANYGLNQHMCKNGLFGEGIYLSSELSVSINFSPHGASWGNSLCGDYLSCIALCEYLNNPKCVHTHVKDDKETKIPNTYIVITNNEMVRVRYILFYGRNSPYNFKSRSKFFSWLFRNKYKFTLGIYTLALALIGLANSQHGPYYRHIGTKTLTGFVKYIRNAFWNEN